MPRKKKIEKKATDTSEVGSDATNELADKETKKMTAGLAEAIEAESVRSMSLTGETCTEYIVERFPDLAKAQLVLNKLSLEEWRPVAVTGGPMSSYVVVFSRPCTREKLVGLVEKQEDRPEIFDSPIRKE